MNIINNGLVINTIHPSNNETVNIDTIIQIHFNTELNTKTITNNVLVFKDTTYIYNEPEGITFSKDDLVKCSPSYDNKTLYLKPKVKLTPGTKYVIYIKELKDVEGNVLKNCLYKFFTSSLELKQVEILKPKENNISIAIPDIVFKPIDNDLSYMLQISKTKEFNSLEIEKIINIENTEEDVTISLDNKLDDGIYYYRIKAFSNDFSEIRQFYIKSTGSDDILSNTDDEPIFIDDDMLNDDENVFIEKPFSKSNLQIDTKLNYITFILQGKYSIDDIDIFESYIDYEPYDADDNITRDTEVTGNWFVIYDELKDISTIIFKLNKIKENTDTDNPSDNDNNNTSVDNDNSDNTSKGGDEDNV